MPLHLLGKKSWNVYNADNVAKVRRDEADARAKEEAEEQRMQEVDAERRLQLLRGQQPAPLTALPPSSPPGGRDEARAEGSGRHAKRRRLAGEDDTDRDIRLANAMVPTTAEDRPSSRKPTSDAPLTDHQGHINLFPASSRTATKNTEAEAEKAKKRKEYEDQYTMRFSNAAGFKQSIGSDPWYSAGAVKDREVANEPVGKDVWGNEDRGRKERAKKRIASEDPLMSVRRGVRELKRVEGERKRAETERRRKIDELELDTRRRGSKRRELEEDGGLEGFSLDAAPEKDERERKKKHRHHHSEERDRERHHRHHRREGRDDDEKRKRRRKEDRKQEHDAARERERAKPGWEKGIGGRYSNQFAT